MVMMMLAAVVLAGLKVVHPSGEGMRYVPRCASSRARRSPILLRGKGRDES
jgi:hypothetical protein